MSTPHDRITISIERDLLSRVRADAAIETRSTSQQIEHILKAGYQRLSELERLAAQRHGGSTYPAVNEAGRAHLARHAELCGAAPSTTETADHV